LKGLFNTGVISLTGGASSQEMVALLVQTGLFDTSLTLCQTFNLSLTPVFEGLTFKYVMIYPVSGHFKSVSDFLSADFFSLCRCIKLRYKGDQDQTDVWNWLAANQLPTIITTKESRFVKIL